LKALAPLVLFPEPRLHRSFSEEFNSFFISSLFYINIVIQFGLVVDLYQIKH